MRIPKSKALYVSAAMLALFAGSAASADAAYKTVTVQDNGQRKVINGFTLGSLASFLKEHRVDVSTRDRVFPRLSTTVSDGMDVVIERPIDIQVVDGAQVHPRNVSTFAKSVGQLLAEEKIVLKPTDRISLPLHAKLQAGDTVRISRIHRHVTTKTREIPFQTIRQRTDALYVGQQHVLTHGVKGLLKIQSTSVFVNGHRVRQIETTQVTRHPVDCVVLVGSRPKPFLISARGLGSVVVEKQWSVVATAYRAGGRTATGWYAQPGVVAVDPNVIPIGTKLYIPGVGVLRAEDTGGAIVGNRIDICVDSEVSAEQWGIRSITVYQVR